MSKNKPKILIATGIYPPDIGGPAKYAFNLEREFRNAGLDSRVVRYGKIEKILPIGLRHFFFLFRLIFVSKNYDVLLALDTFSVGLPSVIAGLILRKRVFIRVGGDFLWESYINRTGACLPLSDFYKNIPPLSFKEGAIFYLTKTIIRLNPALIFNTAWQRDIWLMAYSVKPELSKVIENIIPEYQEVLAVDNKKFIWAGRPIKLKQAGLLEEIFTEVKKIDPNIVLETFTNLSSEELMTKIRDSYALILPSVSDVSPNFILDGLSHGKPFICTKYSGLLKQLDGCGVFIDPCNRDEIRKSIMAMARGSDYHFFQDKIKEFFSKNKRNWPTVANDFINQISVGT